MDEKLMELVRKCEESYDMSDKKYSDSVWTQIGEEMKKSGKFQWLFVAHFEVTIIQSSPKF